MCVLCMHHFQLSTLGFIVVVLFSLRLHEDYMKSFDRENFLFEAILNKVCAFKAQALLPNGARVSQVI